MKNKKSELNLQQKQQLAEVMGNTALAVFTIGALNPLFSQINQLISFQLMISVIIAIIIEVISLIILKK